jgi:hypothetical protein
MYQKSFMEQFLIYIPPSVDESEPQIMLSFCPAGQGGRKDSRKSNRAGTYNSPSRFIHKRTLLMEMDLTRLTGVTRLAGSIGIHGNSTESQVASLALSPFPTFRRANQQSPVFPQLNVPSIQSCRCDIVSKVGVCLLPRWEPAKESE